MQTHPQNMKALIKAAQAQIKKHKIISFLILLGMIFYPYYQYLTHKNRQGYCLKEHRILSPQEKIDKMLAYIYKQPQPYLVPNYFVFKNKFISRNEVFDMPDDVMKNQKFYPLSLKKEYANQENFVIDTNKKDASSDFIESYFYTINDYPSLGYVYQATPKNFGYQASFAEFKALNKDCCSFYRTAKMEDNGIYEIEEAGGTLSYIGMNIIYWYDENWAHKGSSSYTPQKRYISKYHEYPVTNCGENSWEESTQTLINYDEQIPYTTPFAIIHFLGNAIFNDLFKRFV